MTERKGVSFREEADPDGDTAICAVFFMDSTEKAASVSEALRAENIGAGTLYSPDVIDYHVYAHWVPIINQRTWTEAAGTVENGRSGRLNTGRTCAQRALTCLEGPCI